MDLTAGLARPGNSQSLPNSAQLSGSQLTTQHPPRVLKGQIQGRNGILPHQEVQSQKPPTPLSMQGGYTHHAINTPGNNLANEVAGKRAC